jgi:hypothetical protein
MRRGYEVLHSTDQTISDTLERCKEMYYRDLPQYREERRGKFSRDYESIERGTELLNFTRPIARNPPMEFRPGDAVYIWNSVNVTAEIHTGVHIVHNGDIFSFGFYRGRDGMGSICTPDYSIDIQVLKESARLVAVSTLNDTEVYNIRDAALPEDYDHDVVVDNIEFISSPPLAYKVYPVKTRYAILSRRGGRATNCTGFIYKLFHRIIDCSDGIIQIPPLLRVRNDTQEIACKGILGKDEAKPDVRDTRYSLFGRKVSGHKASVSTALYYGRQASTTD